jgi:hypothetical protein
MHMSRIQKICCSAALFSLLAILPSFALIGIGAHYGLDFSLGMKNTSGLGDQVVFDSLKMNLSPIGLDSVLVGRNIPAYVTRSNWKSDFSFGGKIYIDVIPVIDAVEVSANFGLWEYNGAINYPTGLAKPITQITNASDPSNFTYKSEPLTLDQFGLSYFGIKNTPYAKLQLDLTVRKYLAKFPPVIKTVKLYAGAGLTEDFATPMLSNHLVQDAINESATSQTDLSTLVQPGNAIMKSVVNKIISGLTQPTFGAHIDLGVMVKIPVIPIGIYVDGKFMIPFAKLDKYVDIGGTGVLLNGGIALTF